MHATLYTYICIHTYKFRKVWDTMDLRHSISLGRSVQNVHACLLASIPTSKRPSVQMTIKIRRMKSSAGTEWLGFEVQFLAGF